MEKWEYDLGNPQEEAPRRIQKKNYKKRLKWLGIAAAVVLAVVAVALLWDHGSVAGLRRAVNSLSARERRIMELRFGLLDGVERTQKEVADAIGISQSYISRLEKRIIRQLREQLGE